MARGRGGRLVRAAGLGMLTAQAERVGSGGGAGAGGVGPQVKRLGVGAGDGKGVQVRRGQLIGDIVGQVAE